VIKQTICLASIISLSLSAGVFNSGAADEAGAASEKQAGGGKVIRLLQDFETGSSIRNPAGIPVRAEISDKTGMGKSCLRISVPAGFDWTMKGRDGKDAPLENVCLYTLSCPYLPPEADAIRMKVKVVSGRTIIAPGCPVSQMGNSDVLCDPQLVEARGDAWQTVEFSLNNNLVRNFRRANFTKDLPVVYFTRWAQEPIYLYLVALPEKLRPAEDTEIYIDQVELISKGEGRPFPKIEGSKIKEVSSIADFTNGQGMENVFSVAHGYSISKAFEAGYRRNIPPGASSFPEYMRKTCPFMNEEGFLYTAPRYSFADGPEGRKFLQAECEWAEEGQIITFKTQGDVNANAFKFTLKADYPALSKPSIYSFDVDGKKTLAVDIIVFVSPKGADFPWNDIGATDELKQSYKDSGYKGPGSKYDYLLTTDRSKCIKVGEIGQAGAFGFYSTRRHVPAGEWSDIVVPFADFICVYGQGSCKDMQAKQLPLSPGNISAIGVLAPYGTGHGAISFQKASYVSVPGNPAELRSYWQVPDPAKIKMIKLPRFNRYGTSTMMTAGEDAPDYMK